MVDKEVLYSRIQEIEESLDRLAEISEIEKDLFLNDRDLKDIACYRLLVVIEGSIAICQHICAKAIHQAPKSYAECFTILEKNEIITADLADNLRQMARFRNMLVHVYWDIDYEMIYNIIKQRLGDVREYISQVMNKYS